ncbi:MAG: hypothetical protein JST87_04315 [Bacteroidetes bacterium]|nr:hypothetical protein [Bacteroidota bacterium]
MYPATVILFCIVASHSCTFCILVNFRSTKISSCELKSTHTFRFPLENEIHAPEKILSGKGNQYRYILVSNKKDFPGKKTVTEAYANSLAEIKDEKR